MQLTLRGLLMSVTQLSACIMIASAMTIQSQPVSKLEESIISHEGLSPFVYKDTLGVQTIGIGRNVDPTSNVGLQFDEMVYLMRNDIAECKNELNRYKWYTKQDNARKDVLTELCFNMGLPHLLTFKKMILALDKKDYQEASRQLLDSKWRKQVGKHRSKHLSEQLKTGVYS